MPDSMLQDLRYAVRSLFRRPLVTSVAILSLALGIGVNSAIFSIFDRMLLRRLPVPAPSEIVNVTSPGPRPGGRSTSGAGGAEAIFSYPLFRDLERLDRTGMSRLAAHREFGANLAYRNRTSSGDGLLVSGSYFPVLGLAPALGRLLTPDDDRVAGAHPVVVLAHRYWATQFGSDPAVLNATLIVNGEPLTIVGVAPPDFNATTLMESPQIFVPLAMTERIRGGPSIESRRDHWLYLFARLNPDTTRGQAQGRINVPFAAIMRDVEYPVQQSGLSQRAREQFLARRIVLTDGARGSSSQREEVSTILTLLMAVTGFVLLIACANVANLLLARAADRSTEVAVRLAIGASTWKLVRLFLIEAGVLGVLGGGGALVVAKLTVDATLQLLPPADRPFLAFELNVAMLLFTLALGVGTSLLFGLFPAVHAVRTNRSLAAQSGRASGSRATTRFRTGLATAQIALATALLALAGLFIVSLVNVGGVDLGIRRDGLVTFRIAPYRNGYTGDRALAFAERLEDELRGIPGVTSVAASTVSLLSGDSSGNSVTVEGFDAGPDADTRASYARVGPGYFETVGMTLTAGRDFTRADTGEGPKVAIVNEAFARKFNLRSQVIGKRMALGNGRPLDTEIIGLVRDARYSTVRDPVPPQFFQPYRQHVFGPLTFYVRSSSDSRALLSAIPDRIAGIEPNLPVEDLLTMDQQIWESVARERILATLSSTFAGLATLLAAIGLYAMLAYAVAQRLREIGIRIALGAKTSAIWRLIFMHVGAITLVGGAIGVVAALGLGQLGRSLLFGLEGSNYAVIAAAAAAIIVVALVAGLVPARRAARVNPVEALRAE